MAAMRQHCIGSNRFILKFFFAAIVFVFLILAALSVFLAGKEKVIFTGIFHWMKMDDPVNNTALLSSFTTDKTSLTYLNGGLIPHDIVYLIENRNFCERVRKETILIAVTSAPSNVDRRRLIRKSWGSNAWWTNKEKVKVLFLLGNPNNKTTQDTIKQESANNRDIIQQDFIESYRNLTFKSVMFLEWVTKHCLHTGYVMKVDDDVTIDIFQLISLVKTLGQRSLICRVHGQSEVLRTGKWAINVTQLPEKIYPPYCNGPAIIYSKDIIEELFQATWKVPFVPVEDVYITGLLVRQAGSIHLRTEESFHTNIGSPNVVLTPYADDVIPIVSLPLRNIYRQSWANIFCRNGLLHANLLEETYKTYLSNFTRCLDIIVNF